MRALTSQEIDWVSGGDGGDDGDGGGPSNYKDNRKLDHGGGIPEITITAYKPLFTFALSDPNLTFSVPIKLPPEISGPGTLHINPISGVKSIFDTPSNPSAGNNYMGGLNSVSHR